MSGSASTPAPRTLVVAARAEDALRAAQEASAERADGARLVVLAGAPPDATAGWKDIRAFGLEPGRVGAEFGLAAKLRAAIAEHGPELVYGPEPSEPDPDRRAAAAALAAALGQRPEARVRFYGVERAAPATELEGPASGEYVRHALRGDPGSSPPATTAVISTWNKRDDVRANLEGLRAQTLPFAGVVVVDNASSDGTAEMIAAEFPEVRLVVMPHARYGACETFNIGFASCRTELTAILDDDVVLPPHWLERATERLCREPTTTAIVSTKIVEPGMPEGYRNAPEINCERYMSTFRGCASLARSRALAEAEYYDERLFIYGNERDLTCRLLNLGYRVLQYPGVEAFHKTPFGIKMGKRSLYYHARNAWLAQLKYAPLRDLLRLPFLVLGKVLLRSGHAESSGRVAEATGTIGIGRSVRETPGAWRVLLRASLSVLWNVPYCLRRRHPVRAPDFELPIE